MKGLGRRGGRVSPVVVLEKSPGLFLIALFMRGFWLEVDAQGEVTTARYLHGARVVSVVKVGLA